jgi:hypothetical protein
VKQPVQRESQPRSRSTWTEPVDELKPYGLDDESGVGGLDDPNPFVVLKDREY